MIGTLPRLARSVPLLAALVAAPACSRGGDAAPESARAIAEMDRQVPAYSATTLAGEPTSLGALAGKVVLLNVWATWCAPCREEIPYLQSLHDRYVARGFELVGVSVDARGSEKAIEEFRNEFRMTYPIWLDPDERVQTQFRALGVPSTYLIDRDGIMRWKKLGAIRKDDPMLLQAIELALGKTPRSD